MSVFFLEDPRCAQLHQLESPCPHPMITLTPICPWPNLFILFVFKLVISNEVICPHNSPPQTKARPFTMTPIYPEVNLEETENRHQQK